MSRSLIIRNVEVEGRAGLDVHVEGGRIAEVGRALKGRVQELDGRGGALIPGLIDHHIHLLAAAAQAQSVRLDDAADAKTVALRLRAGAAARASGAWLRAVGYHEGAAGVLAAQDLDRLCPDHPIRVQHRSGGLWMLNSLALARVIGNEAAPPCVELDGSGQPTGRIWRGDAWLSERIGRTPPPLAPIGGALTACGVTGVTDASATTGPEAADLIAKARRAGDLPQRVRLMSAGPLDVPEGVRVGPLKVLLDEHDLPDLDGLSARIGLARSLDRRVAMHCATAVELAFALAAFGAAGALPGDRIEHGSVIPPEALPVLAALGLTVVTQPGFVFERGDRYLAEVPAEEQASLYRIASLMRAGVPVAVSSDAPYSSLDPWAAMRAAVARRTRRGGAIALAEAVRPELALSLYQGDFDRPGGPRRRIEPGAPADLCLLAAPLRDVLHGLDAALVRVTIVAGKVVFERGASPARRAA